MENETQPEVLKIDLGCGPNKKAGYKGMDILPLPGVDYVVDIEKGFGFIADNSVDEFYTSHFLEHVNNLELILSEIYRTLKPGGICRVFVPHFSHTYYYSEYTHKRVF
jgi:predicted SAM-dependent methyltransferase